MEISEMRFSFARCAALAAGVSLFASGLALAQFDSQRPFQRASDEYLALLMKGSYAELERASGNARKGAATISDGQPLLAALYGGTAGCVMGGCANRLTDDLWKVRGQKLADWRKRYPDSVTAKVALASFPIQYGWYARGSGPSSAVSAEGGALFSERLGKAHKDLEGLDAAAKHDSGWFTAMLAVARLEGWPKARYDALYEAAAREHPLYLQIHFEGATYYSPQWYGSREELRSFTERAVGRTRDRLGESLYARLNWGPNTTLAFVRGEIDWPRMRSGFERLIRDYPDPWNTNNYAKFACQAQDWPTVSKVMVLIDRKPIASAWFDDLKNYENCRAQAAGGGNPGLPAGMGRKAPLERGPVPPP